MGSDGSSDLLTTLLAVLKPPRVTTTTTSTKPTPTTQPSVSVTSAAAAAAGGSEEVALVTVSVAGCGYLQLPAVAAPKRRHSWICG